MKKHLLFHLLFFLSLQTFSQEELSRLRIKVFPVQEDTIRLDSLSVVEESVIVSAFSSGLAISKDLFEVDPVHSDLIWKNKPATDSIKVVYRTFPFKLARVVFHKDVSQLEPTEEYEVNPFSYTPEKQSATLIDFGSLDYNGSFARGLSFGNNQDVVLNSSFNLQLAGNITEDIEVVAALTDNNIPIQPDGSTQQLQEFDKVFIQITKDQHKLIVGDYDASSPEGYFLKYYKRLQGGSYTGDFDIEGIGRLKTTESFAVAKGKYNRYELNVGEGNQGPYKLVGANGETFIIILAGTERVFINGKLQKRGSDNDYIIDYNLGEIIFTPNVLITQDLRVTVEFEYSERSYFRSLIMINNQLEREKVKLRLNFITEQDSKNQTAQADLDSDQKEVLQNIGDNLDKAIYPGFEFQEEFEENRIRYRLDEVTENGITDSIFIYSTNPDSAVYNVVFTFVGSGNGDYIPSITTVNGRVFEYVQPIGELSQGSYSPFRILITPKREQMVTLGMDLTPTDMDLITIEGALSNNDLNTFSNLDKGDNVGAATKVGYRRKIPLGDENKKQRLEAVANYEFVNHNFREFERYRSVEFDRDWNYARQNLSSDEHLTDVGIEFLKTNFGNSGYEFSSFIVGDEYKGYQQRITSQIQKKGFDFNLNFRHLTSEADDHNSKFMRPTIELSKSFKQIRGWKIGGRYDLESNKIRDAGTDTLRSTSFYFTDWRVYITNSDSVEDKVKLEYIRRQEFVPKKDELELSNTSNTYNFNGQWVSNRVNKLGWQLTYRYFDSEDSVRSSRELSQYYLGRIEYGLTLFKGAISSNILYELGAGQEQKIDYTWIDKEQKGLGNYNYNDLNDNGVQEDNEFTLATFNDGRFIRVLNPTNEFDPVDITQYNQILSLNPKAVWFSQSGIRKAISRFSTITSLQIDRKVFRGGERLPFNPFLFDVAKEDLVSFNSLIRNSVFFNRNNSKYSLEYTLQDSKRKINQVNGFEINTLLQHIARIRWNIVSTFSTDVKYTRGTRTNDSELFTDRVYNIEIHEVEPQLRYLLNSKFRVTLLYNFFQKENTLIESGETALKHEGSAEIRYNVVSKSTLNFKFSYATVDYSGSENSSIEFVMLQGLQDGRNYIWTASFDRTVGNNIQLRVGYEGRKTGDADMVHVGRAEVRATF